MAEQCAFTYQATIAEAFISTPLCYGDADVETTHVHNDIFLFLMKKIVFDPPLTIVAYNYDAP